MQEWRPYNWRWFSGGWTFKIERMRLMIVDDQLAFAEAISVLVNAEDDLSVVATVTTPDAAEKAAQRFRPDVAVVDVELGDESGVDLAIRLREQQAQLRVLMVSCHQDAETICAAIRAGASGFITKECAADDLIQAIRGLERDESWIPTAFADVGAQGPTATGRATLGRGGAGRTAQRSGAGGSLPHGLRPRPDKHRPAALPVGEHSADAHTERPEQARCALELGGREPGDARRRPTVRHGLKLGPPPRSVN